MKEIVEEESQLQVSKTNTFLKKVYEFLKIEIARQQNGFEKLVEETEPNDSSLVAKYTKVMDLDLSKESSLSVDGVTLSTMHIPHPLHSFMKKDSKNIPEHINIERELQEAPVLLFIHGLGGQMSQFHPLMGLLSQCLEIVALDLPGFGNSRLEFHESARMVSSFTEEEKHRISSSISKMNWDDFSTDNIVKIVRQFTKQAIPADKKILLIGHSMGTHLAIKLAKCLPPHTVEGLILLSPPGLGNDIDGGTQQSNPSTISMLKIFTYVPWLFNCFRVWDRLEGLESKSVLRQLCKDDHTISMYSKLRQLRWNMDINSNIILKYINGFKKATFSDLVTAIHQLNDDPKDHRIYQKTLIIGGTSDQVTSVKVVREIDRFLSETFNRKVSCAIEINNAGHSLLLMKPEFVSGMVLRHIETNFPERLRLSPAWVLKLKADISGDKWGLKNELKWLKLQPISGNIARNNGKDVSPLLAMKTLREDDEFHSPATLEDLFYGSLNIEGAPEGKLIAIVDISADIPPYNPTSLKHVKYYKCATVSKVVPDQVSIRRFIQLIDDILKDNKVEDPLIAVHCHYGFNRTGFLICCYLVERLGWSVEESLAGFKAAREPGIKHPHFIDALYVRYQS
ncbi:uncharacterized protein PRCAT00005323001 [Priceomyces carsonii]|uniref:uncharacterized protein n=1 Tax=Priceomyces carsonii TaxID=28549 RepID=UPI002ED867FC|nr:unnamed protein product [Priceomyces carsonii]